MSINSIDHEDMTSITTKWDHSEEYMEEQRPAKQAKSAEARRRIEALREIKESGLTLEEARELGLIH
ncbi:PA3496 family putative envelope integrity protein [Vibrio nomapromontoriensis]|uniref:PA3496 family putative envelope integrity protein n=1 Tax=Vibrio nomapromontoriensis TaxID=2910246 RepID=UPI003D0DB8BF